MRNILFIAGLLALSFLAALVADASVPLEAGAPAMAATFGVSFLYGRWRRGRAARR